MPDQGDKSSLSQARVNESAEGNRTIHHLCTTPASQVMPVELQLASRICHIQNLTTATAQFNQQRTALGHKSHPEKKRLLCEGVSVDSTGVSAQTDCVSHMPKQTSDVQEDWQTMAEYYMERPRIMMCGRAAKKIYYFMTHHQWLSAK
ncbi:hypothetical protein cypCar_00039998 [Cyprinus carpio]|nr:hypothetical protein cypCar_00039998 [Cyprinus carpio]